MENPATWGKVIKVINKVLYEHEVEMRAEIKVCGASLGSKIYNALKEKGYVVEDTKE